MLLIISIFCLALVAIIVILVFVNIVVVVAFNALIDVLHIVLILQLGWVFLHLFFDWSKRWVLDGIALLVKELLVVNDRVGELVFEYVVLKEGWNLVANERKLQNLVDVRPLLWVCPQQVLN